MNDKKILEPPTNLDPEYLYVKYEPLRKALFNKFKDRMANEYDKQELIGTVNALFMQLTQQYNPNIGVDFPYYIKKMLDLRTYHYVTKYLNNSNKESYTDEEFVVEDNSFAEELEKLIDLDSIDPDIVLGDKHRKLMIGLLIEKKTLKELAEEEGVPPDRIHARLYFLLRKLCKHHDEIENLYGYKLY